MKKLAFILFVVMIISLLFILNNENKWSLFVYPYGNISEKSINTINGFSTFKECKNGFEFNKKSFNETKDD